MKQLLYVLGLVFGVGEVLAQPGIEWQRCLGGNSVEEAFEIQQTNDGGYIMAGVAGSNGGDVSGAHGATDFWIVKLNPNGQIQWKTSLGGTDYDVAFSIQQTVDGGYIAAGKTYSNNGQVSGNHGDADVWVVKLNQNGILDWQKTFGGSDEDVAESIKQTLDGGYIFAGYSSSTDGDAIGNAGLNYWVVKLDDSGTLEWQKSYGGSNGDLAHSIILTNDGGYLVTGETYSSDGDVSGSHGDSEYWIIKLSNNGTLEWQKALGGCCIEQAFTAVQTFDGGYAVVGTTGSYNSGQVSGGYGYFDCWVAKLDQSGDLLWQKALGGNAEDYGQSIFQTIDGGYIVGGTTYSNDGDISENDGIVDFWVVRLNGQGQIEWEKTLGGTDTEISSSIQQTTDGGYIVCGYTHSNDGDVQGFHGLSDAWVVKLSPESTPTTSPSTQPLTLSPNPVQNTLTIQTPEPGKTDLQIHNLLGQALWHQSLEGIDLGVAQVDISLLPRGLYLVSVSGASGQVYSGRFLKE